MAAKDILTIKLQHSELGFKWVLIGHNGATLAGGYSADFFKALDAPYTKIGTMFGEFIGEDHD